ncbi:MAG: antibiotic biosynthesis monooxygenase [Actinomycetota bacterium]|nr:antibiotic biosynthesis monooxygenase [Actinomycetota bacterium]
MIVVTAHARIKPEARDEAIAAAAKMRDASVQEPGCQEYGFWFAFDDPNRLLVFERWDDQAALDAHFATPHLAEFAQAIPSFVDGAPDIRRLVVDDESAGPLSG